MSSKDDVGKSVSIQLKCLGRKCLTVDTVTFVLQKPCASGNTEEPCREYWIHCEFVGVVFVLHQ